MMRPYRVFGPLRVDHGGDRFIDFKDTTAFWNEVEAYRNGLSLARGVYLFAMKASRGFTPWYVGKAAGAKGFRQEVFAPGKLVHYNAVLSRYKKGAPVIFLLYPVTSYTDDIRAVDDREVSWVENYLISVSLQANPRLRNKHGTALWKQVEIPGILNAATRDERLADFLRTLNRQPFSARRRTKTAESTSVQAPEELQATESEEAAELVDELDAIPDEPVSRWLTFLVGSRAAIHCTNKRLRARAKREAARQPANETTSN